MRIFASSFYIKSGVLKSHKQIAINPTINKIIRRNIEIPRISTLKK